MNDQPVSKPGPALSDSVEEVQGIFPNDAALQRAIGELTVAGFDRAALSLPTGATHGPAASPTEGAAGPVTDADIRQTRTMGTSMAGTIGALAAAGATIATGGAAGVAIAAAAAVGAGSALAVNAVGNAADTVQTDGRNEAASAGRLVLAVHAPDSLLRAKAQSIMTAAGATQVGSVARVGAAGVDSTAWTG